MQNKSERTSSCMRVAPRWLAATWARRSLMLSASLRAPELPGIFPGAVRSSTTQSSWNTPPLTSLKATMAAPSSTSV